MTDESLTSSAGLLYFGGMRHMLGNSCARTTDTDVLSCIQCASNTPEKAIIFYRPNSSIRGKYLEITQEADSTA
jgi:hypothetical protein